MGRPRQVAKCLQVDSSELSEVEEEAPTSPQQPMAHHLTEVVVHPELAKVVVHPELANVGDAEEEMVLK